MKKVEKKGFKFVAILLVILMLFTGNQINLSTYAELHPMHLNTNQPPMMSDSEGRMIRELTDQRDRFTKYFEKDNGSEVAIVSAKPIHYRDEKGNWKDIDNTLVQKTDISGNDVLVNQENDMKVTLPTTLGEGMPISIESDVYRLSFTLLHPGEQKDVEAKVIAEDSKALEEPSIDLSSQKSVVQYADVLAQTDIRYDILPDGLKESIVVKEVGEVQNEYVYEIQAEGLTASLQKNGSLEFLTATGEVEFVMPAPYMFDSAAVPSHSSEIAVDLQKSEDHTFIVTYSPNLKWLQDDTRVYPVTIDPTVIISTEPQCVLVSDWEMNTNYLLVTFNLPNIPKSSTIISAKCNMSLVYFNGMDYYAKVPVSAYQITSDWGSRVNVDTLPSHHEVPDDYLRYGWQDQVGTSYNYDVTKTIFDWYSKENNFGLEFIGSDEVELDPNYLQIEYISNKGFDERYEYHEVTAGRAGIASVNDFTGALFVERGDMGFPGNLSPVGIKMCWGASEGWVSNYDLLEIDSLNTYFINEQGMKVYWTPSVETTQDGKMLYQDDRKSGYQLLVSDTERVVTAPLGDQYTFHNDGSISIGDVDSAVSITVNKVQVSGQTNTYITDGAGRVYRILSSQHPASIDYLGATSNWNAAPLSQILYTYDSNNNLKTVTYPDGKTVNYTYDSIGNLITITDVNGYRLRLSYTDGLIPRVEKIEEFGSDDTAGNWIALEYGPYYTRFEDVEGTVELRQFNNMGKTVSVLDKNGTAVFSEFQGEPAGGQMIRSFEPSLPVNNLLDNPGFEFTNHSMYTGSTISGNSAAFDYQTPMAHNGAYSLSVSKGESGTGEAVVSQTVTPSGLSQKVDSFTLSAYVYTEGEALCRIGLKNLSTGQEVFTDYMNTRNVVEPLNEWKKQSVSIEGYTPGDTYRVSLYLKGADTAYFDDLQLAPLKAEYQTNLMVNGDFFMLDSSFNSGQKYWEIDDQTQVETVALPSRITLDSNCFALKPSTYIEVVDEARTYVKQRVLVNGSAGDSYVFGGWAKANAAPFNEQMECRTFGMQATPIRENGTAIGDSMGFSFNPYYSDWQYGKSTITLEEDAKWLEICFTYSYNIGTAYFDGAELFQDESGWTPPEDPGMIEEYMDPFLGGEIEIPVSDDSGTVLDENGNAIETINEMGVKTVMEYDAYKNLTLSRITDGENYMDTVYSYTPDGNLKASMMNAAEATYEYQYDTNLSTLTAEIAPSGRATNYTYDAMQRKTSASMSDISDLVGGNSVSNTYTYDGNYLKTVSHNGFTYTHNYTPFGDLSNIMIGTRMLRSNSYLSNSRRLLSDVTFGNGQSVQYGYNPLNQITSVQFDGNQLNSFEYRYDNAGKVSQKIDWMNQIKTDYIGEDVKEYDLETGSLIHSYQVNTNEIDSTISEQIGNHKFQSTSVLSRGGYLYTTDFGESDTYRQHFNQQNIEYDSLGRKSISRMSLYGGDVSNIYEMTYTYAQPYDEHTSENVESILLRGGVQKDEEGELESYTFEKNLCYRFDGDGNLLLAGENNVVKQQYFYDELGQLTRINDATQNKTYTYTYDIGGNLRMKRVYSYHPGSLNGQTPLQTRIYSYTDSGWGDLLTRYDSQVIVYDEIGNPISYGDWDLTWEGGRMLRSMEYRGDLLQFRYNDDGNRTQKTFNGVTTRYTYLDHRVTFESDGTKNIYYYYDRNNNLIAMNYNGTDYFYLRNVQDDVIALLDAEGNIVVEYAYDPWGKLLSITGSLASTVGIDNPYRYRGYRYDNETGLYYLKTRYYNPEWGRFLNADEMVDNGNGLLGTNMFAYANNNPIRNVDHDGRIAGDFWAAVIVKRYQERLNTLGYKGSNGKVLAVDGSCGPNTIFAIKEFQKRNYDFAERKLVVDGVMGNMTYNSMMDPKARSYSSSVLGTVSYSIVQIQRMLNYLGYLDPNGKFLVLDGSNGPKTTYAVKEFQRKHGLVVDGSPGPKTQAVLFSANAIARGRIPIKEWQNSSMFDKTYAEFQGYAYGYTGNGCLSYALGVYNAAVWPWDNTEPLAISAIDTMTARGFVSYTASSNSAYNRDRGRLVMYSILKNRPGDSIQKLYTTHFSRILTSDPVWNKGRCRSKLGENGAIFDHNHRAFYRQVVSSGAGAGIIGYGDIYCKFY